MIIGHNIISFDIPFIQKIYPDWTPDGIVRDTLILSRLLFPEIISLDMTLRKKHGEDRVPKHVFKRHNLESWGYRLGVYKGDFGKTTNWEEWSPEMQEYCEQDTVVTQRLFNYLMAQEPSSESVELEHRFQEIIFLQEYYGFPFDTEKASKLYGELSSEREKLKQELQEVFPPKEIRTSFTPKVNRPALGYKKGVPTEKVSYKEFNPNSQQQIAERLTDMYNWTPEEYTPTGQPQVTEDVLTKLDYPEAPLLKRYMMLSKRLAQLAEGPTAWLKLEKDGVIHGRVKTCGTVTGRCTHNSPNVAQVPSVRHEYGKECRELFGPPEGYYQLGADASGLELRCLAHYLSAFDGGEYAGKIVHGDIHTIHQESAGLPTRDDAKTFI